MRFEAQEVQNLGEKVLLDRLIWRRLHCLAGHIANYLQLKDGQTRVLSHWACYKVTQPHLDNESAAREIGDKLRNILEYESRSKLQVPLLLELGEGVMALLKATNSGDTDLVYMVLLHLKEKMGKNEFELTIRSMPLAHSLYIKYCASHNRDALRQVYVQVDDFHGQATTHIQDALEQTNPGSKEASLISARECYKKGKNDLVSFVGLSVHDTIKKLLEQGEIKGSWAELETFSKSRKSPAGYEPFVDACLAYKRPDEAAKYLPKCKDELKDV
ncbi:unnamed protein product [Leptidea sinapis]|uniref:Vps16 C-terminal domain-containing protein n=1 Tax=Leptidea sinapis TaxID=189913 RepID=A0A5E4QBW9_9NEOP|nr:unnamed protein product [Leptidea sinapis]